MNMDSDKLVMEDKGGVCGRVGCEIIYNQLSVYSLVLGRDSEKHVVKLFIRLWGTVVFGYKLVLEVYRISHKQRGVMIFVGLK